MRPDKEKALALRRKGKSYREIVKLTGIPKGTLFEWFHSLEWSQEIKDELSLRNGLRGAAALRQYRKDANRELEYKKQKARIQASRDFKKLKSDRLFVSGIMLYWGEGYKSSKNGQVRLANTDPNLLRTFIQFLKQTCSTPEFKIKAWLLL